MRSVNNRDPRSPASDGSSAFHFRHASGRIDAISPRHRASVVSERPSTRKKSPRETCPGGPPPTRMRAKGSSSKFESGHVIASRISKSPSNVKIVHVPRAPTPRIVRRMQSSVVWWAAAGALWLWLVAGALACSSSISKRPARAQRPPARPQPPPRLNVTFPTFKCEPDYSEYYCLNGGTCFTVVISDSPIYNCECRSGFVGQRCEFKDLDDSYVLTSRQLMMETASIAGGATVAVFLAILVCFGAWVRLRRRDKEPSSPLAERGAARVQLVAVLAPRAPAGAHSRPCPGPAPPP